MLEKNNLPKGGAFAVLAALCYSGTHLLATFLLGRFVLFQILFFQSLVSLCFLLPCLKAQTLKTPHWRIHLLRSLAGISGYYFIFFSLKTLNLVDVMTLNFLFPFLVPLLSYWWLKEQFLKRIWWAIGLGFIGTVIVLNPTWNFFHLGGIFGVASAIASTVSLTAIRCLNLKGEPQERILGYLFLTGIILSFPPAISLWVTPTLKEALILSSIGVLTILNQLFLVKSFKYSPAYELAPFGYSSIVFAAAFNWIFQQETSHWSSLLGAIFIGTGGLLIYFIKDQPQKPLQRAGSE